MRTTGAAPQENTYLAYCLARSRLAETSPPSGEQIYTFFILLIILVLFTDNQKGNQAAQGDGTQADPEAVMLLSPVCGTSTVGIFSLVISAFTISPSSLISNECGVVSIW